MLLIALLYGGVAKVFSLISIQDKLPALQAIFSLDGVMTYEDTLSWRIKSCKIDRASKYFGCLDKSYLL